MRTLLRQRESGCYLQPAGQWDGSRETALDFINAVMAYRWISEHQLDKIDVVLALSDPQREMVLIDTKAAGNHAVVNCQDSDWSQLLHSQLYSGHGVDLINFDYDLHGESCELIAQAFLMEFTLDRDPQEKTAHFLRKPDPNLPARVP